MRTEKKKGNRNVQVGFNSATNYYYYNGIMNAIKYINTKTGIWYYTFEHFALNNYQPWLRALLFPFINLVFHGYDKCALNGECLEL